jgi:hypothetical protein
MALAVSVDTDPARIQQVTVDLAGELIADDEAALRKLMAQQ